MEFATTTNLTTSAVVVSTALADDYTADDTFIGWFTEILNDADGSTSTNLGIVRRITDYTASSGTVTVAGANFSAEDESVDVRLTRLHPNRMREHFNRARLHPELAHVCAIIRDIDTIVTGQSQYTYTLPTTIRGKPSQVWLGRRVTAASQAENEITDPGFEDWSSATALTSWTLAGSGSTVNQEEQTTGPKNYTVLEGSNSARVLSNASDETTLLQTVTPTVGTQRVEANLSVWVYNTQTAVSVTARIASTNSAAHGGTGWERLTVSANIAEATTVSVGIAVATGTAFSVYVDEIVLVMGQSEPIDVPWAPILNYEYVPPAAGASNGGTLRFPFRLREQARIRVIGLDNLSSVSALTDTIEIAGPSLDPLYAKTRELACQEAKAVGPENQREFWEEQRILWQDEFDRTIAAVRLSKPNPHIKVPDWGMARGYDRDHIQSMRT